jgi:hypothetical protein
MLFLHDRETHIILPYIMELELLPIPEELISPRVFRAVRVVDSLVFCVVFCHHCLFFVLFFPFLPLHCLPIDLKLHDYPPLMCSKYSYKM